MIEPAALSGLLQLSSAALPVGAFSHSLGVEAAVEAGLVRDMATAEAWIADLLEHVWARGEAVLWLALHDAWATPSQPEVPGWNDRLLAARESQELLLECTQTGHSLRLWLLALPDLDALDATQRTTLRALQPVGFACGHALAALSLRIAPEIGLHALGWSLLENLCASALKLIPLGQTQAQAMLRRLSQHLPAAIARALDADPENASTFAPMLAILSAQHETQYSRLFRS